MLLKVFDALVPQSYRGGFEEPPTDYNADNSRSDLSDILEEEEEDLCSDHLVEGQARGYSLGANRVRMHVYVLEFAACSWTLVHISVCLIVALSFLFA